jgi:uncharacterized membrane protein YfcA
VAGSVPAAFLGVLLLRWAGTGPALQGRVKLALGIALLVVATGLVIRPLLSRAQPDGPRAPFVVRKVPTLLIGILGGLVVGITSVGSGSLIIIMLLLLYPRLRLSELVGTDLVQAVPLVASAALGHILFGEFRPGLTVSILLGSVPGVFLGAHLSARAPDYVIRPALIVVLTASALKLLGAGNLLLAAALVLATTLAIGQAVKGSRRRARPVPVPQTGGDLPVVPEVIESVASVSFPSAAP